MRSYCSSKDESGFCHRQSTSLYWRPRQTLPVDKISSYILPKRKFKVHTYLHTYLLTYSMQHSSSWETNRFSASQEITRIEWNPTVHYRLHKCPPPVPILSQIDSIHALTPHSLKFRLYVILPSTLESSSRSFSPRKPLYTSLRSPIHATCPAPTLKECENMSWEEYLNLQERK